MLRKGKHLSNWQQWQATENMEEACQDPVQSRGENSPTVTTTTRITLNTSAATNTKQLSEPAKYRQRDVKAMFFNACEKGARKKQKQKKKKAKRKPWTNKQRREFALAHWQTHHGNDVKAKPTINATNSTTKAALPPLVTTLPPQQLITTQVSRGKTPQQRLNKSPQ